MGNKLIKRYSEGLKRHIVEEVESGKITQREAVRMYGVSGARVVNRWVHQYGKRSYATKIVRVTMKSESDRLKELEQALADEVLRNRILAAQLKSYEGYVPDLKKRLSMKELKQFEKNQKKLERFR
jgi:transposase-like protein